MKGAVVMPESSGTTVNIRLLIQAVDKASKTVAQLQERLNEVAKETVKLSEQSKKSSEVSTTGMKEFKDETVKADSKLDSLVSKMSGFGSLGLKLSGLAAAMAAPFIIATTAAAGFERSMSKVRAVTSGAEENFEDLKQKAAELGRTTEFTAKQAAEGMVFLGQAGLDAKEVIEGITPSLTLAVAAGVELAQAADMVTNIVSAMRLPVSDLSEAVDVLANTTANANTNMVQLADAMVYAGPLAAASKVPLEEVAAIIGVLGNNGIQASMAGTAMRGMLRSLTSPTEAAQKVLDDLGVTIKISGDGTLDLVDALHQLGEAQLTAAQANKLFGRFAAAGALAVTANTEELDKLIDSNYAAQGAAEKMAETMKTNLKGAFIELFSAVDGFRRLIGDPLIKPMTALVHAGTEIVNWVNNMLDKFPVLTSLIVRLSGVVIILTGAMGALALAIASVSASLALLSVKVGETLTVSGILGGALGKLRTGFLVLGTSLTSLSGILNLVNIGLAAVGKLFNTIFWAVRNLFALFMKLHPVLRLIAVIGAIIYAIKEWNARTQRLIRENGRLAASLNGVNNSIDKSMKKIEEMDKDSERYTNTTKAMREELLRVAEKHEELEEAATAAAESINEMTGQITDGGKALEEFRKAAKELQLEALRRQSELLTDEWRKLNGQASILNATLHSLSMTARLMWALMTDGVEGVNRVLKQHEEENKKAMDKIKGAAEGVIATFDQFGEIDMSSSREEMLFFLTEIRGYAEDNAKIIVEKFEEMKKASDDVAQSHKSLDDLTFEDLGEELDKAVENVQELGTAYDEAVKKSENAAKEFKRTGSVAAKAAAQAAYLQRVKVNNERKKGEADLDKIVAARKVKGLAQLKEQYDADKKEIERKKDLKDQEYDTEWEYDQKVAELDLRYAKEKNAFLTELLADVVNSNGLQLQSYTDLSKELKRQDKEVEESSKDLADAKIKHANEVKDAIIDANRKAAKITTSLEQDPIQKLRQEKAQEIAILKKNMADKGIVESQYRNLLAAVNKKYTKEEEDVYIAANIAKLQSDKDTLDTRASYYADALQREFDEGRISAAEYTTEVTRLQTEAIDREIAILEEKLKAFRNDVKNNPIVIELKGKIEALEAEKEGVKAEEPSRYRKAETEALIKKNTMEQQFHDLKMERMRVYNDGLNAMYNADLEAFRLKQERELILFRDATDDKLAIIKYEEEQKEAMRLATEDAIRQATITRLGWYSEMASSVEGIFADLYEATGKKRKEFLYAEKAAAIATTIMNAQAAMMKAMAEMGPIAGKVMAALIAVQAAAAVARISAQPVAEGGEIKGTSPHDKADNIIARVTAKEWVMPVKAVKKYGKSVMTGIQKGLFPEEVFKGYRLPVPIPAYSRRFASGGEVMSKKELEGVKTNQPVVTPPPQPITIMNVTDPSEIDRYLNTSSGQDAVINILSSRAETVRRVLR